MFHAKKFCSENYKNSYLEYLEFGPESSEKLPLIIYLHGNGDQGDCIEKMSHGGVLAELEAGRNIPAIVIAPQCNAFVWFELFPILTELIDTVRHRDDVDINRVYIMGTSMGAYAVWQMCLSHPDWFAAAVPVCGGGMYWAAERLKNLPIWAFHGALDTTVLPEESIHMVKTINWFGGNAKITIIANADHNAWDYTYSNDEMWKWLFSQRRVTENEY